ncbi:hypothetical protein JTE90_027749 [Oedothorax gibbosus]|uniref:Uncharacterized protein n=1 Tax=Oedothorax gibbosus TaxID=931172 RepID=A0AAV6V639_9ARAC|nr:hypothetical protein JTE90_027749 [Oedothorax gibbosus]
MNYSRILKNLLESVLIFTATTKKHVGLRVDETSGNLKIEASSLKEKLSSKTDTFPVRKKSSFSRIRLFVVLGCIIIPRKWQNAHNGQIKKESS